MGRIKVGAVSYLNTKPLVHGFSKGQMQDQIEMVEDYPSRIATMLLNNEIDLGLVPVAIIPALSEYHIVSDYCIGAVGEVASVCLFSDVPLEEVDEVLLDYQSRTSVNLARILLRDYWKVRPLLTNAAADFREHIGGKTAGLVIGDRAFEQRKVSKYKYDLGEAWLQFTGLPFVFAAWISNKQLDASFTSAFNLATGKGLGAIGAIVQANPYPLFDLNHYFTRCISYTLDTEKKKGLALFLEKLYTLPPLA